MTSTLDSEAALRASRDQAWFWTPEWQAGEREASEDIAAGRTTVNKNPEDMFSDLGA